MHTFKIIFLALSFCQVLSAQKLETGDLYKNQRSSMTPNIMGQDDDHIYIADLDLGPKSYINIQSYDINSLNLLYNKEYEMKSLNNGSLMDTRKLEKYLFLDKYHTYIVSSTDIKENKSSLIVSRINAQTGEELPDVELQSVDLSDMPAITATATYLDIMGQYRIHTSKNKKRLLVHFIRLDKERNTFIESLDLFDSDLQLIKSKKFEKKDNKDLIPSSKIIDNEGSLYYISYGELVFLDFYKDYEEWREEIPTEGFESNAKARNISGGFNPNGDLILTATYITTDVENLNEGKDDAEQREGDTQVEGFVFLEVDGFNKEIKKMRVSKFDPSLSDEFLTEKLVKYNVKTEINDIFNRFTFHYVDGETVLIGEALGEYNTQGDLLVNVFDAQGSLKWSHRLGLMQYYKFEAKGFSSFIDQDKLHILIQDEEKNYENGERTLLDIDEVKMGKYSMPVLFTYDLKNGNSNYQILKDWESEKGMKILPVSAYQAQNNEPVYFFYKDGKLSKLGKITF